MVRTTLAIEREVDDTRCIRDMGTSAKRKESQSSSSFEKKQRTSASLGFQRQRPWPRPSSIIQGMFLLSHLWARILFDSVAYACDCVC